ncbi:hypothetical protein [Modestobacter versicolor]|uniref:hypothetical protein n=1 Tax=Modestobacter versicolor TaxID=429133 RepID=UPI0034DF8ACB
MPPAPPAAAAATPPQQLPFGLTGDDVNGALRVVGRSLLPVLGGLTVVVAVVALFAAPDGHGGSLADWLRTAVLLLALSLGGRAVVDGSLDADVVQAGMSVGVRVLPLVVTVVTLALVARASAAAEGISASTGRQQLLVRSVLTGLVAGVGLAVVVALARSGSVYGVDLADAFDGAGAEVGAGALGAFLGATVLVSLVAAAARARTAPGVTLLPTTATAERTATLGPVLGTLRTFALGLGGAAAVAVVLAFLHRAYLTDDLDGDRWQALAGLAVLGVNAVLVVALGALGVPMGFSAESRGDAELLEFLDDAAGGSGSGQVTLFDSKVWLLALLVPVLVALGTAVRRSVRGHGNVPGTAALQAAAVIGAAAGLAAALLVRVSVAGSAEGSAEVIGASASASASASAGPSLLWAPLLGAAWAAAAVWALRSGPTLALSLPVRVTRLLGGRAIAPEWVAALAGTAPAPAGTRSAAVRLGALVAGLVLVVGALGAAAVAAVNAFVLTPQAAAEEYLDAVADADVAAVLAQLADAPEVDGQLLLSDDVLGSDDFTAIGDVEVGEVSEYGGSASVQVTWSVDGQEVEDSISLVRGDDRFGLLHQWEVAESLSAVELYSDSGLGAQIAGADLAGESYLALPGGYRVHAADHPFLTSDPSSFVLGSGTSAGPSLDPRVKPEALDGARAAVEERLAECAASTTVPLDNCPFLSTWSRYNGTLSDVSIAIPTAPEFSLEYDQYDGVLAIVTETRGRAVLTGTMTDTDWRGEVEVEPYKSDFRFSMEGEVSSSGGDLAVLFYE